MEREENKLFKFATKELSQDAFLCWCINWINYPNHNLYSLGKEMLEKILFPDIENKNLFPNYSKIELSEKYEMFNDDNEKESEKECQELENIYLQKNKEVEFIKKNLKQNVNWLKKHLDIDKIKEVKVNRQFHSMDIVVTINNEYIVIIEDKIDTTTNEQIERYINKIKEIIETNQEKDIEALEVDMEKFDINKIIPVYIKTGNILFNEKVLPYRRINGKVILEVLEKYKNTDDRINDFYECLKDKVEKEDSEKYNEIVECGYIQIGEKFLKKHTLFNCFKKYIKKVYYSGKYLTQRGALKLPNLNVRIWTPRLYEFNGWTNTLQDNGQVLLEEKIEKEEIEKNLNKPEYRYVFPLKKDIFNEEYFEFIGIFSLDTDKSTNNKRIWKKANLGDKVTLNIEDLLKNIAD